MFIRELIDEIKNNKKKIIITFLLLVALITFYIITNNNRDNRNNKIYSDKDIIFTYQNTTGDIISSLPYINIEGNNVAKANKELINKYYEVTASNDKYMTYKYYENERILSLIVKVYNKYIDGDFPEETIIYNVDINRKMIINDNELKNIFGITNEEARNTLSNLINEYYSYEERKGYINDCDFTCYLNNVGDLNNAIYYVKDNSLYAYLFFTTDSDFMYDTNNSFDLFNFKIK